MAARNSSTDSCNGKVEDSAFATVGLEDSQTTGPLGFTTDGKTLYWLDSRGRDTAALVAQDVASGRQTTIAEDPRADIGETLSDPKTGVVQAWSVDYLRTEWQSSDPAIKRELAWLESQLKGDINVTSRTDARRQVDGDGRSRHRAGETGCTTGRQETDQALHRPSRAGRRAARPHVSRNSRAATGCRSCPT